jgi:integrase
MASIRKRGERWQVRIQLSGHPEASKTFPNKKDALLWAKKTESDMERGVWLGIKQVDISIQDALARYSEEVTPSKKGASRELNRIKHLIGYKIATKNLCSVRGSDVAEFRDTLIGKGYAPATVKKFLELLSSLFNTAISEWGYESLSNPVRQVKKPIVRNGRVRRLKLDEEAALIRASLLHKGGWLSSVIVLAIETAMRRGEIAALRIEDIDFQSRVAILRETKNGETRIVPLSLRAMCAIESLASGKSAGRLVGVNADAITGAFQTAVKRASLIDLRVHDLRHEGVSRLFEKGLNALEVAAISGHKTLSMLQRYTHLKATDLVKKLD